MSSLSHEARRLLRASDTTVLLQTFAALTHVIHETKDKEIETMKRTERDEVKNEILRRTGDLP